MQYTLYLKVVLCVAELYLFEKSSYLKTYTVSTPKIPKLLKQRENETWISDMLQKGGEVPMAVVLTNRTQMPQCEKVSSKFTCGKG